MAQQKITGGNQSHITALPRLRLPQRPWPVSHTADEFLVQGDQALADFPTSPATFEDPRTDDVPPSSRLPSQFGVGWDRGIVRRDSPNEDGVVTLQGVCSYQNRLVPFSLFVIADGMGGHEGGQEAAHIATRGMMHTVLQTIMMGNELSEEYIMDILVGGVEWANMAIFQRAQELSIDMGTTITAALLLDRKAYIINVGDSRTYLYRQRVGLTQITRDHSLVASLVTMGQIRPEDVYTHPDRHKIYRCLGQRDMVKVDWFIVDLCSQDCLLLCSDGLWEMVRDNAIEQAISRNHDATWVSKQLVQMALENGGVDNVSVLVSYVP